MWACPDGGGGLAAAGASHPSIGPHEGIWGGVGEGPCVPAAATGDLCLVLGLGVPPGGTAFAGVGPQGHT